MAWNCTECCGDIIANVKGTMSGYCYPDSNGDADDLKDLELDYYIDSYKCDFCGVEGKLEEIAVWEE